jgi:hypothetical protein
VFGSRGHSSVDQHGEVGSSASAGGMLPMGSKSRRLLNQYTHSRVANSTASKFRQGPRR